MGADEFTPFMNVSRTGFAGSRSHKPALKKPGFDDPTLHVTEDITTDITRATRMFAAATSVAGRLSTFKASVTAGNWQGPR
jgi:hypothetical protein